MSQISNGSGLHIMHVNRVLEAFRTNGPLGLFRLFFPREEVIHIHGLSATGSKFTVADIEVYLGLEIGMSLHGGARIRDFWTTKPFLPQPDFPTGMSRDKFQKIRSILRFTVKDGISALEKHEDPL